MKLNRYHRFNSVLKKIHTYLGLLNLSILLVFGIAGVAATVRNPQKRVVPKDEVRYQQFTVPASVIDDRELGEQVRRYLDIPAGEWNGRRDGNNNLALAYFTHSGPTRVTVLEKENRLRIGVQRENIWSFFDNLHGTANRDVADFRMKLWTYYSELSIWSLIAMSLSGTYLWLCSRPRLRMAQIGLIAGNSAFVVLYLLSR